MEKERRKRIRKEQMKTGPEEEIFDFFIFSSLLLLLFCNLLNFLVHEQRVLRKKIVDRGVGFIDVPEWIHDVPVLSCQVVLFIKQRFILHPKIFMYHGALLKTWHCCGLCYCILGELIFLESPCFSYFWDRTVALQAKCWFLSKGKYTDSQLCLSMLNLHI